MEKPGWCRADVYDFWMKKVSVAAQRDFDSSKVVRTPAAQLSREERRWLIVAAFHHPQSTVVWNRMKRRNLHEKDHLLPHAILFGRFLPETPPQAERNRDWNSMVESFERLIPLIEKYEFRTAGRAKYLSTPQIAGLPTELTRRQLYLLWADQGLTASRTLEDIKELMESEFLKPNVGKLQKKSQHRKDVREFIVVLGDRWNAFFGNYLYQNLADITNVMFGTDLSLEQIRGIIRTQK